MIQTPAGDVFVFDAHAHFFGRSFLAGLGQQLSPKVEAQEVARRLGWELPPDSRAQAAQQWLAEMDRHGVDRMVLIHTLPGSLDDTAAAIAAGDGRLAGYAMINPLVEGAASIAERAVTELAFRGLALFPAMFRFSMQSDAAGAVLDVANRHGLNVFVHCGALKVGFRTRLGLPCAFDGALANPLTLQRAAAEFPRCNFIIPHLGSGMTRELLMLADQAPNIYADTSGVAGWAKYLDGAPAPASVLKHVIAVIGASRVLFGTDSTYFPRGWRRDVFDQQRRLFDEAGLSGEQVADILGRNVQRLLDAPPRA